MNYPNCSLYHESFFFEERREALELLKHQALWESTVKLPSRSLPKGVPLFTKGSPFMRTPFVWCWKDERPQCPLSILKVPNEQMEKSDREQLKVTVFLFGGLSRGKLWCFVVGLQTLQELEGLIHETNVMKGQHDKVKWNSLYHTKVNLNIQWIRDTST